MTIWEVAQSASHELLVTAMRHFSDAADLQPDDIQALEGMEKVARFATWIKFSEQIKTKLARLEAMRRKGVVEQRLAYLKKRHQTAQIELEKKEKELEALKNKTGVFANLSRVAVEHEVGSLRTEVANLTRELSQMK